MRQNHFAAAALVCAVLALSADRPKEAPVTSRFSDSGIASLRYQGAEFLNDGEFRVNAVQMESGNRQSTNADLTAKRTYDAAQRRLSLKYSWGEIVVGYTPQPDGLAFTVTTRNESRFPIKSLSYELIQLRFPSRPKEFDGITPLLGTNIGVPTALSLTAGNSEVTLVNEDIKRPLLAGFPWALNKPANTIFPVRVNIGRDPIYPDSLSYVDRTIPAKGSDTYLLTLKFNPAGTPVNRIASDLYRRFSVAYPFVLNWPDRRPIGVLFAAQSGTKWPSNPRGWLLDSKIDVNSRAGVADFQKRLLAWADSSVNVLKQMNAQGMVTWDIEGQQYVQPTSYIGDPRAIDKLAPEMNGVADAYFKKFRDAGLRVGVCVRPQRLILNGGTPQQRDDPDAARILIDKIRYAKTRWGATLFYIDSNGSPNSPMDVGILRQVASAVPDVLLIPEHKNITYYSLSAPYGELRAGITSTPGIVRDIYPQAFSFIYVPDGPVDAKYTQLQSSVRAGDSLMFRGWYPDPVNEKVRSLQAGVKR